MILERGRIGDTYLIGADGETQQHGRRAHPPRLRRSRMTTYDSSTDRAGHDLRYAIDSRASCGTNSAGRPATRTSGPGCRPPSLVPGARRLVAAGGSRPLRRSTRPRANDRAVRRDHADSGAARPGAEVVDLSGAQPNLPVVRWRNEQPEILVPTGTNASGTGPGGFVHLVTSSAGGWSGTTVLLGVGAEGAARLRSADLDGDGALDVVASSTTRSLVWTLLGIRGRRLRRPDRDVDRESGRRSGRLRF